MDPQQLSARLKSLTSSLAPGQVVSLVAAFLLVVGIVAGGAWWANSPTYALLYADMEPEAAANMVSQLKAMKVPYTLDEGGRAIRVPSNRVDELRLELAADGPESGRPGFEIFDRTAFGATEFQEQVSLRRALEGELSRTIATLSTVGSARVHITMGKPTLFGEPSPAKASVLLKLRGTRDLPTSTVTGITNLVASSVDGLQADAVTIMDTHGRPLARPQMDDSQPGTAAHTERQQRLEREMGARVVSLLEPVIGADRVRVNVALKLNPATVEQTEETYDPTVVVRSRHTAADSTTTTLPGGGLAGVRSNQPPPVPDPKAQTAAAAAAAVAAAGTAPPPIPPSGGSGASRSEETVNYDISRKLVVTQLPPGDVARISLAVIVDDNHVVQAKDGKQVVTRKPRTPEELQQLQGIVAAAVGLEPDRGDQITVQNVSFEEPAFEEAEPMTTLQQVTHYSTEIWEGARLFVIALLGLLAMIFFVRPLMQRLTGGGAGHPAMALAIPGQPVRTVADLESEIEAQLDASAQQSADTRRLPVLTRRVSTMSAKEPENVAKLLRSWINEGER